MTDALRRFARTWSLPLILLFGLALRLINLEAEPLWGDEILSWDVVRHFWASPGTMLEYLKHVEIHPPLYYLFLRGWLGLAGSNELALRLPSVVFGLATIGAGWGWARAMYGQRAGHYAAAIIAILPLQIEFSQEARPYAMACAMSAFAAWALWMHVRDRDAKSAAAYAVSQALAIGLHYAALLPLVAMATWWLWQCLAAPAAERRARFLPWLAAHGAIFLSFAWWLDAFFFKLMYAGAAIPNLPPRFPTGLVPLDFIERAAVQSIWASKLKSLPKLEVFAQAAFKIAALAAVGSLALGPKGRRGPSPALYLGWLASGLLILYALSPASFEYAPFFERQVLFLTVVAAVAIGALLAALPARRAAALGLLFAATLLPRVADVVANDADWDKFHQVSAVAEDVNAHYLPGDLVVIWSTISRTNFNHYLRADVSAEALVPAGYGGLDFWKSRETLGYIENESQLRIGPIDGPAVVRKLDRLVRGRGAKRVWLYGAPSGYAPVEAYFRMNGWRRARSAIEPIYLLDLYVKNDE